MNLRRPGCDPVPPTGKGGSTEYGDPSDEPLARSATSSAIGTVSRRRIARRAVGAGLVSLAIAAVWWTAFRAGGDHSVAREPVITRLTANPATLALTGVFISPDGRYLAYSDPASVQVRFIDTGETQRLPDTKGMTLYGWSGDSTRVRAMACGTGGSCDGWSISLVGNSRYRRDGSWPVGEYLGPLPDDSGILKLSKSGELRLEPSDGPARVIARDVDSFAINPAAGNRDSLHNERLGCDLCGSIIAGSNAHQHMAHTPGWHVVDLISLPRQRLIVSVQSETAEALYELHADPSGIVTAPPRRLTDWRQEHMSELSVSADGKRLVFVRYGSQEDAYVGDLNVQGALLGPPKRLTLDERQDTVTAWTPDSKSVLFHSNRNGNQDIFRQDITADSPDPVVVGPGNQSWAKVTGNSQWLIYKDSRGDGRSV